MFKKVFPLILFVSLWQIALGQSVKTHWVDSVSRELNAGAKIGQIFMVPVSGDTDEKAIHEIENLIKSHEIGGLIFKGMGPADLVRLTNRFQSQSSVPLLIGLEGSINSILDSTMHYPPPILLGAVQNDSLLYQLGRAIAHQLKQLGINILFTPNTAILPAEPNAAPSPLSFGEDKNLVIRKSIAVMRGLQDNGIIACAQYFPLDGITVLDTRKELPSVTLHPDTAQLHTITALMSKGLKGIVPAAAEFPLLFKNPSDAKGSLLNSSTLTSLFASEWINKNTDYEGLIFVDINNIDKISDKAKDGDSEVLAFKQGNDVLMNPKEIGPAIRKIKRLLKKEDDYEAQLDVTVKKILSTKFDAGLWVKQERNFDNLQRRLYSPEVKLVRQKLFQQAVTVVKNDESILPVRVLEDRKFALVRTHSSEKNFVFYEYLNKYINTDIFTLDQEHPDAKLAEKLDRYDVVFVAVFPQTSLNTIKELETVLTARKKKSSVVICDFGNRSVWPYAVKQNTVVTAYTDNVEALKAVPQILFGALPATGKIPFSPSILVRSGNGIETKTLDRLAYSIPEDANMNSDILAGIDSIAREAMRIRATPGLQVLVARKGKVIYQKNFGGLTYDNTRPVTDETIYDLASVTKVSATLQTAMFLHERGLIDLHKKVSYYLPELRKTNKKDITFMDMLTHQAGLVPFIPMYPETMKDTMYLPQYYSRVRNDKYPLQVSSNLYASKALRDSVWSWVVKSKMVDKPARTPYSYKYSDLGFLIMQRVAETVLNQPLDEFMSQNFYEPLGAYTTGFNPLDRFAKQRIAPTEDDKIYRKSFVSGTVHDERAAMLGGVAGHAGLFSNANDLGKLAQMWLQNGKYGGVQYFKPETLELFTAKKYKNSRRGIGWDKPIPSDPGTLTSFYASPSTFGHTGFTGTCVWVDPEFDLVYIFLSNRVYPDRSNKLSNANIRSRIQDVIYKSIFGYVEEQRPGYIATDFAINTGNVRP